MSQHQSFVSRKGPKKLSIWQKFLKLIGLYKEPKRPARKDEKDSTRGRQESTAKSRSEKNPPRSHTRDARTSAEPRPAREPRAPREKREPSLNQVESCRLYIGNLSYDASESDIEELFKGIGPVRSVEVVYNKHTHRSKGYGFVEMLRIDEAKRAVEVLHDQHFMGRQMIVSGAKAKNAEEAEAASIAREQKEQDAAAASSAPAVSAAPVTHSEPAVAPEQEQAPAAATEQVELPLATAEVDGVVEEVHSLDSTHQKETFV